MRKDFCGCISRITVLALLSLLVVTIHRAPAHAYQLPDTGQNACYDIMKWIPCPQQGQGWYGQDAHYHGPQPAYQDHGNGTVTDLNTGLMWQQGDDQNDSSRTWQQAVDYCAALYLGGHSDWRLPTRFELLSILDYGLYYPAINTAYFPNCHSYGYWSSSTFANDPDSAWVVHFYVGGTDWRDKDDFFVRCVRGGL